MSARRLATALIVTLILAPLASAQQPATEAKSAKRPDIYDPKADTDAALKAALAKASRDHSRVLVMFGGNWCGWCHKLHDTFKSDPKVAKLLHDEYQLVLVDTEAPGAEALLARCQEAQEGTDKGVSYPFLTVFAADGSIVKAQRTEPLEEGDGHNAGRVAAFLAEQKAPVADAREVLKDALARASSEDKEVYLHFGAPWCGWCHRLEDFNARPEIASILAKDFLDVKIDVDRMTHGQEVLDQYCPKPGGIPWIVILDPKGQPVITSDGPRGNIGFPVEPFEIEHYLTMLKKSARAIEPADIEQIEAALKESAAKIKAARAG